MRIVTAIAIAISIATFACASSAASESCVDVPEKFSDAAAYDLLREAPRVWADGWGIAGAPSCYAAAYRHLLASRDAAKHFEKLMRNGSPAGRLYALAGLTEVRAPHAEDYLDEALANSSQRVEVFLGCSNLEEPVSRVAALIKEGDFSLFR